MESSKRKVPRFDPVVVDGIRYEQMNRALDHGFKQPGGIIAAIEIESEQTLWMEQLYTNHYGGLEERDTQDVFVKHLVLDDAGRALLATDTYNRVWSLDLATRAVTKVGGPDRL